MQKMDCFYGTVNSCCKAGIYIITDDGDSVFAYYGSLKQGTRVLCTVQKATRKPLLPRVSIDAVIDDHFMVA